MAISCFFVVPGLSFYGYLTAEPCEVPALEAHVHVGCSGTPGPWALEGGALGHPGAWALDPGSVEGLRGVRS